MPPKTEVVQSSGTLELDHLRLGMPYDAVKAKTEESGQRLATGMWVDKTGQDGALMLTPADGTTLPADDLYFVGGKLAGFFKRLLMPPAEFDSAVEFYSQSYGSADTAPPAWSAKAAFFSGMPGVKAPARRMFWQDPAAPELLFAEYDPATTRAMFGLFQPPACDELGITYADLAAAFDHPVSAPRMPPPPSPGALPSGR